VAHNAKDLAEQLELPGHDPRFVIAALVVRELVVVVPDRRGGGPDRALASETLGA